MSTLTKIKAADVAEGLKAGRLHLIDIREPDEHAREHIPGAVLIPLSGLEAADVKLEAGRTAGEELWRLPVSPLQKDALKSEIADMKNSGERWGGAINAALFLREFAAPSPWVHLDIAGPSQSPKERGYFNKGATGAGVRTLVEYVRRKSSEWDGAKRSART